METKVKQKQSRTFDCEKRVSFWLSQDDLESVDKLAANLGMDRATMIRFSTLAMVKNLSLVKTA